MPMEIPLASTGLRQVDIQAAVAVLNSGSLTMGKQVRLFEQEMALYLKRKHFVMVNSGSSANLAMVEALLRPANGKPKLNQGDKVLVPAIAWPTTIWPIIQLGLVPEFVDIDPSTLAIDLNEARVKLENDNSIKAIFIIHPMGLAISYDDLSSLHEDFGIVVINDVCESLGSFQNGNHAGSFGIASSFSFYFSHHLTTMEGGGIATDNDEFANDLRSIRSHGWSRDRSDANEWHLDLQGNDSKFLFVTTGYNIRPMEIQAAIGRKQLLDLSSFVAKRQSIAHAVNEALTGSSLQLIGSARLSLPPEESGHSWMLLPIQITENSKARHKIKIIEFLEKSKIETRPVLTGNFLSQPSMRRIGGSIPSPSQFPSANLISESAFLVGAHHDMTPEQIDYLSQTLRDASNLL
jgi:CDP-4-dehydro-6-deoxyglucose reductase, E1